MKNHPQIQILDVRTLLPSLLPLRTRDRKTRRALQAHIRRFGIQIPILVDEDHRIIDGHARLEAAKEIGMDVVPAVVLTGRTEAEKISLQMALNRMGERAKWDPVAMKAAIEELIEFEFDLELTGFEAPEIDGFIIIDGPASGSLETLDASNLAESRTVSRPGDVWICGDHRLACGDFRDTSLLSRLFAGQLAQLCFTDPPYNVRIAGNVSGLGKVKHGEFAMASGEMNEAAFQAFLDLLFSVIVGYVVPGALVYAFMDWRSMAMLIVSGKAAELDLLNLVVWVKSNPGMGSFYRSQHELLAVFRKDGAAHINNVELGKHGRSRSNVWNYRGVNVLGPDRKWLEEHPTVKPTALMVDALRDASRPGDIVFDPFIGSGTTMIAAERTQRRCFGIEIAPKFVDLAIRRWQDETGRDAVRESDGLTFLEAAEALDPQDDTECLAEDKGDGA